jgi:RNA polymerase sigma-70 factor (ECF subfamily)
MLFSRFFVHLGEFRNEARFSTWLISIAGNEAFSRRRRLTALQKQVRLDAGAVLDGKRQRLREIQDYQDNAEEACRRLESQTILSNAMRKLTPSMRTVLSLRYEHDLSTKATAKLLGISIPAVKTWLLRARLAARKALNQYSGVGPR